MSGIASRFKSIREDKKLTITAMAAALGENRQRIQDIESGKQRVPEDILLKFIEHFNIDANWLLTGEGDMYRHAGSPPVVNCNRRMQMMMKLMESLTEKQQEEILSVVEDKERINRLEHQLSEITSRLSA